MKRAFLLAVVLMVLMQGLVLSQEREPLAMRIGFEWTAAGALGGAALGVLLWLTDPANPNNQLSDSIAIGAAWGTVVGAGFSGYVMQRNAILPATAQVRNPLHPSNRITTDPIAIEDGSDFLAALGAHPGRNVPGFTVPVFQFRF